jgi:hypothetical protein
MIWHVITRPIHDWTCSNLLKPWQRVPRHWPPSRTSRDRDMSSLEGVATFHCMRPSINCTQLGWHWPDGYYRYLRSGYTPVYIYIYTYISAAADAAPVTMDCSCWCCLRCCSFRSMWDIGERSLRSQGMDACDCSGLGESLVTQSRVWGNMRLI